MKGLDLKTLNLDNKVETINSLSKEEQSTLIADFVYRHNSILSRSINFFVRLEMKYSITIVNPLYNKIDVLEKYLVETEYKFCKGELFIPRQLNLISEIIFMSDLSKKGLFRVNSTTKKIQTALSMLYDIVEGKLNQEDGKKLFLKNFDSTDCCVLYKELLKTFNTTIFPREFTRISLNIMNAVNDHNERIVCSKALYFSLPNTNRCIVESVVFLSYKLVKYILNLNDTSQQMDLDGLAIVMMPNMFLKDSVEFPLGDIQSLVEFTKFFFNNFLEISNPHNL